MALKVKFSNSKKTEVEYLTALETEEFFNGSARRTLTISCAEDAIGVDALHSILKTENNVATLTMSNDETGVENVYTGYVLELACGIKPELIAAETPEMPAQYENRLVFKLGKRTYIEQQLHDLGIN